MNRRSLSVALFSFLFAAFLAVMPAAAQSANESVLPSRFAGWTESSSAAFTPPAGKAAAAAAEYGLASGTTATYKSRATTLNVTLYRMKDPSGAYGEYTYLRTPDMPAANITAYSAMSADHALVLVGNLVLDIRARDLKRAEASLKPLASAVSSHAEEGALPGIVSELPEKDLVSGSDHYILGPAVLNQLFPVEMGDSLGFQNGAEAELARYSLDGREATLLVVDYPTPQGASSHLKALEKQFDINNSKRGSGLPVLYEKRTLTSLVFVAAAKSQKDAEALLGHLESGEVLTWNAPTFSLTQPNIGTIVVGTIIGTGTICLFALISGLAFGGVRLFIKRLLPGKVFDRVEHMEVLQLGLSSKPIRSEDFYGSPEFGRGGNPQRRAGRFSMLL